MTRAWDRLAPKDVVRMQEALLRDSLRRYFHPFSPFYRGLLDEAGVRPRDVRRLSDLELIPPTSAATFSAQADPARPFGALMRPEEQTLKRFLHRSLMRRVVREKFFRGDDAAERVLAEEFKPIHLQLPFTGGPVIGYSMRDLVGMAQAGARMLAVLGLARTDVLVSTLPFDAGLPSWFTTYAAQAAGMSAAHLGGGQAVRPSQAASWMARLGATAFVAQPGYAEGLLRAAPPSAFAALRVLALWGGTGMLGARTRFAELVRASGAQNAQPAAILSVPETRVAWAECPAPAGNPELSHGFHTYPDLEIVEVIDPESGTAVGEAEPGELVYTSLDWRGSALLRYRTGIHARRGMVRTPCPGCGRTVPRIGSDLSRSEWGITVATPTGATPVDLADVAPILWGAADVPMWQLDVLKSGSPGVPDALTAYVAGGGAATLAEAQRRLGRFRARLVPVAFQDLRGRVGVGLERPETRVVVRRAR